MSNQPAPAPSVDPEYYAKRFIGALLIALFAGIVAAFGVFEFLTPWFFVMRLGRKLVYAEYLPVAMAGAVFGLFAFAISGAGAFVGILYERSRLITAIIILAVLVLLIVAMNIPDWRDYS